MFTAQFWREALERAIKTAAQVAVLIILGSAVIGGEVPQVNIFDLDWVLVLGFSLGGALLSILTSVISAPFGSKESPSLVQTGSSAELNLADEDLGLGGE